MSYSDLPAVNASLNFLSFLLLMTGFLFIRRKKIPQHRACMIAAVVSSTVFLTSYLVYHFHVGSVHFGRQGLLRTVYLGILFSHTVLAVTIVPLVTITLIRALRKRYARHRAIARWTLPLWIYVSVTGVVVYFMLYRL